MKRLKIDLEDLCIAMDSSPGEDMRWFLDAETGDTILVTREYDPAEADGPSIDEIEASPRRYLPVPEAEEAAAFAAMQAFIGTLADERLRESLELALAGPRPMRRFKSVLEHLPEQRQRWFEFKRGQLLARAREWLASQGIEPHDRPRRR